MTLLLLGVLLPLYGFGELAEDIWEKEDGFSWDKPLLLLIHARPQLDTLASALTRLGGFWSVTLITTLIALGLLMRWQWRRLTFFLIVLIGNGLINRITKGLLQRVRPQLWESPAPEFDYGFPKGTGRGVLPKQSLPNQEQKGTVSQDR